MSQIKITDLVPQETIDQVKELNTEIKNLVDAYVNAAKELAKGIDIKVQVVGDLDKLERLLVEKSREAAAVQRDLTDAIGRQGQVIANTTNTISRELMEQERINKQQRVAYNDTQQFKELMEKVNGSYEQRVHRLVQLEKEIETANKREKDLSEELKKGAIDQQHYTEIMTELRIESRALAQEKAELVNRLKNEEREAQSVEGSYRNLSQRLELMKKAYKDLTAEERESELGKEMERNIQDLDAHLKDVAADMGEFQRNVGNYAIAGRNGVVATESLVAVMDRQAVTMQDVADQLKILEEGKRMLDTTDENYAETMERVNEQIEENKARLSDVSDIMDKQATSIAEAEAQNKRLSEAIKFVDLSSEEAQERIAELTAKIEENNAIIQSGSESKSSLKKDLKELVLEIATLSIEYQNLSAEEKASAEGQELADHINELIERAGVLRDAIADTNAAISNAASDTRGLDQVSGALKLVSDEFGLASGMAHMFGVNEQELTKIQTDLQAAIAVSNALQSIQNTLQAQSAVMQGANLVQTKLRTIAENLHTAAQGKGVVMTYALTAAQWAFNAAASANPIGFVLVAVAALAAAVWGLIKAFQAFFSPSKTALENYQKQKEALEDLCEANDKLIARMKARGATETELLNQSLKNKEEEKRAADDLFARAAELYDEDEDEYKEALEAKKKADEEFEQYKEDSLNYLMKIIHEAEEEEKKQRLGTYEYKRQLIKAELEQQKALALELLKQEKITMQIYQNIVASLEKAAQMKYDAVNADEAEANANKVSTRSSGRSRVDNAKKEAENLKKAVQAGEDALLKIISDSLEYQRQVEILSYNRRLAKLKEQLGKTKETEVEMRTALNRQIEGLEAEHQRKLEELQMAVNERRNRVQAELIESHLSIVKSGTEEERQWRHKQLDIQYQSELLTITKGESDKTLTAEEAEQERLNLVIKYANLRDELENEFAEKRVEEVEKTFQKEQSVRDNAYMADLNALKRKYLEEVSAAKGNAEKIEKIKRDYERRCAEVEEKYAEDSAKASTDMLEKALQAEGLSADMREELERELAKAKMDMETMMADHAIAEAQRTADEEKRIQDERLARIDKWAKVASDALNAISDLSSAIYDRKIQQVEEEEETASEAADREQERITRLVENQVITQEEGEARKRAAEVKTAQKEEELEKKKAALKHKQAVWDKANQVAQTAINTAAAMMKLWVKPGWPAAIPMMAVVGAMGALQLATILATPIPKYAKGTDRHKGGPAIVGDGGRQEVVLYGGNAWLTPDKPTLVEIPEGATVLPGVERIEQTLVPLVQAPAQASMPVPVVVNNDYRRLEDKMDNFISLIRRQTAIQHRDSLDLAYERFKSTRI